MKLTKLITVSTVFCLAVLPVILVWTYLFKNASEPITFAQGINLFLLEVITGIGALGIGLILVDKYLELRLK